MGWLFNVLVILFELQFITIVCERVIMIELTKLDGVKFLLNEDYIETVEETPDSVIVLASGRKIIVKEGRQEIKNLVKSYRKDLYADS